LRAIRYSKELYDEVNLVYSNDISDSSVKFINENVDLSNVDRSKLRSIL
jgi:tRNA G26 N,N-dimethylase Trm1